MCGCLCTEIQFPQYLQSIKQSSLFKARMNISVTLGRKLYFILQLLFKHYEIFLILVKVQNEMFQTSANYYRPCLLVEVINYNKKGNQVTLLCWGFFVVIHCFKLCPPLVLSVALSIKCPLCSDLGERQQTTELDHSVWMHPLCYVPKQRWVVLAEHRREGISVSSKRGDNRSAFWFAMETFCQPSNNDVKVALAQRRG